MLWLTEPLLYGLINCETAINEKVHFALGEEQQPILMWVCQFKFLIRYNYCGTEDMIALALAAGADVNIQNKDGETALQLAFRKAHASVVKELLQAGADIREAHGIRRDRVRPAGKTHPEGGFMVEPPCLFQLGCGQA